jgi:hypothetical protein
MQRLGAQDDAEHGVAERQRDRGEDVGPSEVTVEIDTPHAASGDEPGVRFGPAEQVEARSVGSWDRLQRFAESSPQTFEVEVVPLRRSRLEAFASDPCDLANGERWSIQPDGRPRGEALRRSTGHHGAGR